MISIIMLRRSQKGLGRLGGSCATITCASSNSRVSFRLSHRPCRRLSRCPSHRPGHRPPSCCLSRRRRPRAAVRRGIAVRVAVRVAFRVKLVRPSGFNWGITARIEYRVGSQDRFAEASFLSVLEPVAGSAAGIIKLSGTLQVEKVR
jgi:hypothetical protein